MEIKISEYVGVMPSAVLEEPLKVKIILNEDLEEPDVIESKERLSKTNGGKFTQYTLFLEDKDGVKRKADYLFERQLAPLVTQFGMKTQDWANQWIEIKGVKRENTDYIDLVFSAITSQEPHQKVV